MYEQVPCLVRLISVNKGIESMIVQCCSKQSIDTETDLLAISFSAENGATQSYAHTSIRLLY